MKRVLGYYKPYIPQILLSLVFVLLNSFAETGIPGLLKSIVDDGIGKGDRAAVMRIGGLMVLLIAVAFVFAALRSRLNAKVAADFGRDLRKAIFTKIENLSLEGYNKYNVSSLLVRTTNDVQMLQQISTFAFRTVLTAPVMIAIVCVSIARVSGEIALIVLIMIPIMVAAVVLIGRAVMPLATKQQEGLDTVNRITRENLTGVRVTRAFNNNEYEVERFAKANKDYTDLSKKVQLIIGILMPMFFMLLNAVTLIVVWKGTNLIPVPGSVFTYGTLMQMIQFVTLIMMQLIMISMVIVMYPRVAVSAERIAEVLDEVDPVVLPETPKRPEDGIRGQLEMKNLNLRFDDSEPVLRDINFKVTQGQTLAIIGGTGSGKSTLLNLIPRLLDGDHAETTKGEVLVDGLNVKEYDIHDLRKRIAYAPQKAQLFTGSIRDNILYGKDDATDAEIEAAIKIASAEDFIAGKKDGLEEFIAEGGANLSGGQKQRLSIARAVVREAEFYVFDDTFSALDFKTEKKVRTAVEKMVAARGATMIVVGQRISSIKDADNILVIDEGKIVGQGTHKELLKSCDVYIQIASSQLSEEELENE